MNRRLPTWANELERKWTQSGVPPFERHASLLKQGIRLLSEWAPEPKNVRGKLPEQPFDGHLLSCSPAFRKSRELYLKQGGRFIPSLVSSPRTLISPVLLESVIEYSPIERELIWLATDRIESRQSKKLLELRTFCSSLFHEQNHRILWGILPPSPSTVDGLRRYLNFAESLVITLDMALADHLGPKLASLFYLTGVTYDPGTSIFWEIKTQREYRNYLQAALHATYLNLEFYEPKEIPKAIEALFPSLGDYAARAAQRSGNLDRLFVHQTNPLWQKRHQNILIQKLSRLTKPRKTRNSRNLRNPVDPRNPVLTLPADPMDNREIYLLAEQWFDLFGF